MVALLRNPQQWTSGSLVWFSRVPDKASRMSPCPLHYARSIALSSHGQYLMVCVIVISMCLCVRFELTIFEDRGLRVFQGDGVNSRASF